MNTVTKCSPARSRRLARIAMAFACLLPGCEAATREGRHAQIEEAAALPAGDGSLRIAIDTRIEAYGAVYERRLLCTVSANGSVSRVAGRPVVQRSLARSFADPPLTPAPGCAGTRHMCR